MLREAAGENTSEEENLLNETEDEDSEIPEQPAKTSRKKLFLAFVGCLLGFALLVLILCWFFGIGAFAAPRTQAVDRTKQTGSSNPAAPVTEDEKLKMALNLVAEKNPKGDSNSPANSPVSENAANSNSSVDLPPAKATELNEPVVVPDALSEKNRNPSDQPISNPTTHLKPQNSVTTTGNPGVLRINNSNQTENQSKSPSETKPLGTLAFFGVERQEKTVINPVSNSNNQTIVNNQTNSTNQNANLNNFSPTIIPFGTLLPVRLLGAVYTLRRRAVWSEWS